MSLLGKLKALAILAVAAEGLYAYQTVAVPLSHGAAGHVVQVTSGSESAFIAAVLADLGAPATQANVSSLASWFPHEFPSWPPAAANNPMASTMPEPGAAVFNGAGVRNYVSATQGAQATAATLADGNYPRIVADLKSGRGLCGDPSLAAEFLIWSGGGYSGVC